MDIERQKRFIVQFIYWLLAAGIVYVLLKYAVPLLMPFVIGSLVAIILRPLTEWLARVTRINRKVMAILILLLFYATMGILLFLSGAKIVTLVRGFIVTIPNYYIFNIEPALQKLFYDLTLLLNNLDPSLQATIQGLAGNVISSLANMVTSFSSSALNWLTGFAGAVPGFMINFIFAIVTSFFLSIDFPVVKTFILRQLGVRQLQILRMIKDNALGAIGKYIKAYAMLMTLTFVELAIGMWLAGVHRPGLVALGIAIFDVLPVLGTGGILVPWVIIDLIIGNTARAVKILILYAVVTTVRNTLEPKVVGEQIGLHPLITLLCMYIGTSLFGVVGLLGLPIAATIAKNLNDNGTIKLFKK
ncbi:MAG: sporulation integral membrane protein YtvI [Clostridiales bacterium]